MSFEDIKYFRPLLNTVKKILMAQGDSNIVEMLNSSDISVMQTGYGNWNGGVAYYTVYIDVNVEDFVQNQPLINEIEQRLIDTFNTTTRFTDSEVVSQVVISPKLVNKIDWSMLGISSQELIKDVEYLRNVMISVGTGGRRIQDAESKYQEIYNKVVTALQKADVGNPNVYRSLWDWYGKWKSDFPTYQERRDYIREMYDPIFAMLSEVEEEKIVDIKINLTGWDKIKRVIIEINKREKQASSEEQFQAVGMLCREVIITLAQTVYCKEKHPSIDGVGISGTDAKRMLESYIAVVLSGGANEELRAYAKITNKLANALTHKRTATKKEMMLCTSATLSLINIIGILEEKF